MTNLMVFFVVFVVVGCFFFKPEIKEKISEKEKNTTVCLCSFQANMHNAFLSVILIFREITIYCCYFKSNYQLNLYFLVNLYTSVLGA